MAKLKAKEQAEIIDTYISEYPELASNNKRGLAKLICMENPERFGNSQNSKTVDGVRGKIRYRMGATGKRGREKREISEEEAQRGSSPDFDLPDSLATPDPGPYTIKGTRMLVLPDCHIPYHDKTAMKLALMYGNDIKNKLDIILLNGDFIDCYAVSRWRRDPTRARLSYEIESAKHTLENSIRKHFPNVGIIYKFGNHEERYEKLLLDKVPELSDIRELQLENVLDLARYGVQYVPGMRDMEFGHLSIIHGHEYSSIYSPINPARGVFRRAQSSILVSHTHQTSEQPVVTIKRKELKAVSTGCLCDTNPDYAPKAFNKWNNGFADVELVSDDGWYRVHNYRISNGKIL